MIVVGAYADCLPPNSAHGAPIATLSGFLDGFAPKEIGLHLLPFCPSSGDFGFAPDDYCAVRPELGSWKDVEMCARRRPVIVDGIYNHVGINHEWVRGFFRSPSDFATVLHAYRSVDASDGPVSPRGSPVLRPYVAAGEQWHLWQTFTDYAVDVRLESKFVRAEIVRHLKLLRTASVRIVRLDAIAYWTKALGGNIRHNAGVHSLAMEIADLVRANGLEVIAQVDCDEDGAKYFSEKGYSTIPINDFTFATYLALAFIDGSAEALARYMNSHCLPGRVLVRAPRTHDGILLRSKRLSIHDRSRLLTFADRRGIALRSSGDEPYELNCSAPFLYGEAVGRRRANDAVELAMATAALAGGWAYFYLPFLLGCVPEDSATRDEAASVVDPRALNRRIVSSDEFDDFEVSGRRTRMRDLLRVLVNVHSSRDETMHVAARCDDQRPGLLMLEDTAGQFRFWGNFHARESHQLILSSDSVLWSSGLEAGILLPLGYAIVRGTER